MFFRNFVSCLSSFHSKNYIKWNDKDKMLILNNGGAKY
jgi:hypothetical protein